MTTSDSSRSVAILHYYILDPKSIEKFYSIPPASPSRKSERKTLLYILPPHYYGNCVVFTQHCDKKIIIKIIISRRA